MHKDEKICVRVNAKLKEIACIYVVDIDKWIWIDGLSFSEMRRLITWRVSKWIKNRDDNEKLISESTHELNSDMN